MFKGKNKTVPYHICTLLAPSQFILYIHILISLTAYKGAATFQLTSDEEEEGKENYRMKCQKWHKSEKSRIASYRAELDKMPQCPCAALFLVFDRRFSLGFLSFDLNENTFTVPVSPRRDYAPYGKV
jgi:hypothetical protein